MESVNKIMMVVIAFLALTSCEAQIKNPKTETVKVYGNCEMCKKTIEKAANEKGVVKADWNTESNLLVLTYDSKKTNSDAVLKKVAYAGYDSDRFLAPDEAYNNLRECCQYTRPSKSTNTHQKHQVKHTQIVEKEEVVQKDILDDVYKMYFFVKDALITGDVVKVAEHATHLSKAIEEVSMDNMKSEQHTVWMNVLQDIQRETKLISGSKDIKLQRIQFAKLSVNIFSVLKVFRANETIYYQYCPMFNKGSNWLSKEETIKNPFYGSSMLTCGNTVETIK